MNFQQSTSRNQEWACQNNVDMLSSALMTVSISEQCQTSLSSSRVRIASNEWGSTMSRKTTYKTDLSSLAAEGRTSPYHQQQMYAPPPASMEAEESWGHFLNNCR
jgi:hypothetical protein